MFQEKGMKGLFWVEVSESKMLEQMRRNENPRAGLTTAYFLECLKKGEIRLIGNAYYRWFNGKGNPSL